jgi:CubicO group peptidase (beta-lactamase class C family)
MSLDGTPGLSLAVVDRDGLALTQTFGVADVASGTRVTPEHLFETGSIGKSFTAVALLQLADEGQVDLQAPVTEYLPWFSVRSEHEPITLHHLLSHTAGISSGIDFAPAGPIQVWNLRESVATTTPGTNFHYSNLGYKVLGEVLRAVTGKGYGPTIQSRILNPLGLVDSTPTITSDMRHRLAIGYGPLFDDRPWWPGQPLAPATWLETDTADGCLAMTAADLATYLQMLLGRGAVGRRRVLSEEGYARLTQRAIPTDEPPADSWYGYGIVTGPVDGRERIGHGGGMVGYFSGMIGDVESGVGVVALVNGPGSPNLIARTTLDYVLSLREGTTFAFPDLEDPDAIPEAGGPRRGVRRGRGAGRTRAAPHRDRWTGAGARRPRGADAVPVALRGRARHRRRAPRAVPAPVRPGRGRGVGRDVRGHVLRPRRTARARSVEAPGSGRRSPATTALTTHGRRASGCRYGVVACGCRCRRSRTDWRRSSRWRPSRTAGSGPAMTRGSRSGSGSTRTSTA